MSEDQQKASKDEFKRVVALLWQDCKSKGKTESARGEYKAKYAEAWKAHKLRIEAIAWAAMDAGRVAHAQALDKIRAEADERQRKYQKHFDAEREQDRYKR